MRNLTSCSESSCDSRPWTGKSIASSHPKIIKICNESAIKPCMKPGTKIINSEGHQDAKQSEQELQSDARGFTTETESRPSLPQSHRNTQEKCTGHPAAGSAVNECKTGLQLPGTHLCIQTLAQISVLIKPSLMYRRSMKLQRRSGRLQLDSRLISCSVVSLFLYKIATRRTKIFALKYMHEHACTSLHRLTCLHITAQTDMFAACTTTDRHDCTSLTALK